MNDRSRHFAMHSGPSEAQIAAEMSSTGFSRLTAIRRIRDRAVISAAMQEERERRLQDAMRSFQPSLWPEVH